jgi:hypothetical protein
MEIAGLCREEFVRDIKYMLDSLLASEKESEKYKSYKSDKSKMERLREVVGALVWPILKALTLSQGGDGEVMEGCGYEEGVTYLVKAEYLYQYTHVGEKSPYTQLAEQFRAGTNRGWWTVFTELVADEDNSIAVGDAEVLVGLFLGKRCEHKKKRVLGEGGGGDDGWRLEYQQLEVLYQEEVDSHKATLADLEDARDKIRRLEKKVTRLQAAVNGQQE